VNDGIPLNGNPKKKQTRDKKITVTFMWQNDCRNEKPAGGGSPGGL